MSEDQFLLVTDSFYPDDRGSGRLMTGIATGLKNRGLDVSVCTCQPHYHENGMEKCPRKTTYQGVPITRIRAPQIRQSSLIRRGFNWAVFTVWMSVVLLLRRDEPGQRIVFNTNPPMLPIAMWVVCSVRGWPYTYIVHDLYPAMAVEPGYIKRDGLVHRAWSKLNEYVFDGAEHIIGLGERMRERVIDSVDDDFDQDKIDVIPNWENQDFIEPRPKEDNWFSQEHELVEKFVITYSGNIGANHDLETIVDAAQEFTDTDVKFLIIGNGDHRTHVVDHANRLGLTDDTIEFLPFQDREDIPYSLTCGDISLVTVSKGMKGVAVSSKLPTSLAVGQPILVIAERDDDEAEVVRKFNAGKVVEQDNPNDVVSAIEDWRSDPKLVEQQGRNARKALENHFTKDKVMQEYYQTLTDES